MLRFLLREASLIIDNISKSQVSTPTKNYHSIYFPNENVRIPLLLHGIFLYFPFKKPSLNILNQNNNNVLFLTNSKINLHNKIYTENEQAIVDYEDNIREKSKKTVIVLKNIAPNHEI